MNILALDSSAKVTSAAVGNENGILAEFNAAVKLTHSQTLMPMVSGVLSCAGLTVAEIDCFAVSAGPGSFTGLRIGIGAVKGLAYGTGKPCVGVSTLDALARNLPGVDGIICAAMDARCNQVYTACFESSGRGLQRLNEDEAISVEQLGVNLAKLSKITKNIFFVGDGAELCYNKLNNQIQGLRLAGEAVRFQKAASVILAARERFLAGETVCAAELLPTYLRLPQAQRSLLANAAKGAENV